ncbi:MAG: formylglycine-generating enzyme family protein [Dolichospermum sp.]
MLELEMVLIPGGTFLMGSPEDEKESRDRERPQHEVTVPSFSMGKYPVTQKQWRAVAALEKVDIDLEPDPSYFKGDNRPVECVSWGHAQEFCARLSRMTNKTYRLPTEAQWEYACRAGTTTPFYCGKTISTKLANYDGNYTYGDGTKGVDCQQTINVGSFPPNAFGLYDMHGNVWEWCQDTWHENYINAPEDGSDWISQGNSKRVLRGGSWYNIPGNCRSASRNYNIAGFGNNGNGFRVVCDV